MITACTCRRLMDENEWTDLFLEKGYLDAESQVSHGICPDCVRELYPELAGESLDK